MYILVGKSILMSKVHNNTIIVFLTTIVKIAIRNYYVGILNAGGGSLIIYEPFWHTLKYSDETTYTLIKNHHISSSTIDKLRKNKPINTTTINDLCRILNCKVEEILKYQVSDEDQIL